MRRTAITATTPRSVPTRQLTSTAAGHGAEARRRGHANCTASLSLGGTSLGTRQMRWRRVLRRSGRVDGHELSRSVPERTSPDRRRRSQKKIRLRRCDLGSGGVELARRDDRLRPLSDDRVETLRDERTADQSGHRVCQTRKGLPLPTFESVSGSILEQRGPAAILVAEHSRGTERVARRLLPCRTTRWSVSEQRS